MCSTRSIIHSCSSKWDPGLSYFPSNTPATLEYHGKYDNLTYGKDGYYPKCSNNYDIYNALMLPTNSSIEWQWLFPVRKSKCFDMVQYRYYVNFWNMLSWSKLYIVNIRYTPGHRLLAAGDYDFKHLNWGPKLTITRHNSTPNLLHHQTHLTKLLHNKITLESVTWPFASRSKL